MRSLKAQVFFECKAQGALQYLHIFDDYKAHQKAFRDFIVSDEFDHTFLYQQSPCVYLVFWKNKNGLIQFCGSGAYAAAAHLLQQKENHQIILQTENSTYTAYIKDRHVFVEIPRIETSSKNEKDLFFCENSGVYLLRLHSKEALFNNERAQRLLVQENIHSLCFFYWNIKSSEGFLRYFVPKYGRPEDYATGSVHQYLTPLISKLYEEKDQRWSQLSKEGGVIHSSCSKDKVTIRGNYSFLKI